MAKPNYDIVVEAAHYGPDGSLQWVRAYERRGPAFSDIRLLPREVLIDRMKSGARVIAGQRRKYLAGTFDIISPIRLLNLNSKEVLVTGERTADQDSLEGVPAV